MSSVGKVIFIGAGPGAADLITVRGAQRLAEADVVLFDALADPALRAYAPKARWIDVGKRGLTGVPHAPSLPMYLPTYNSTGQDTINALLVHHAGAGNVVVRLKGGDPSIFGRLEEELEALAEAGIDSEVVPGVTAAIAAAAATQRPLTRRGAGRSVSFTTAMTREGELRASRSADTEVFYMAGRQLAALSRRLLAVGWPASTPVCVVSRAGWPDQLSSDHSVETLARATVLHAGRPAVVTVGAGATPLARRRGTEAIEATDADADKAGASRGRVAATLKL
ncbi:MAG: uroporphyrinogen-III C-methyltransferase [Pseudomonadota bacterium]|nr:uroporphyrinogen-III C-methyltransferase [Pseudomonadota bacterium]